MGIRSIAAAAAAAFALASTASAATVNVGGVLSTSGIASFYEANFDFILPTGFTDATLTISEFYVDDRGVLQLNGTTIDSAGIPVGGSLNALFDFNDGNGSVPFTYAAFNGSRNVVVTSGFVTGTNALRLFVNDTHAGVQGTLLNGPGGPSNTTGYGLVATLTYQEASTNAVPEPATWALMIAGFGGAGTALRRRRRACAV